MLRSIKQVCRNNGAPVIDRVTCKSFKERYSGGSGLNELKSILTSEKYKPKPVRRVYIPKDNGDKRPLGIPCVIDRVHQQMYANILTKIYEPLFADESCGFRPKKSATEALRVCFSHLRDGKIYVIDMDLAKFFDTVNHKKLKQILSKQIKDVRVLATIHKMLKTPIIDNGRRIPSTIGTPQGGNISPILANILLNEMDQRLKEKGISFVRYADDMMIFCSSMKAAKRIMKNTIHYLEETLLLKVNTEKTKIGVINRKLKFLGHCFYRTDNPWGIAMDIHAKSKAKHLEKLKELTPRNAKGGLKKIKKDLDLYIRGWANYYHHSKVFNKGSWVKKVSGILRRRIRAMLWHCYKSPKKRKKKIREYAPYLANQIGVSGRHNHRKSCTTLNQVFTNSVLVKEGFTWTELEFYMIAEKKNWQTLTNHENKSTLQLKKEWKRRAKEIKKSVSSGMSA
ncbi:group II intron reverse transcriptase/maturase [Psittacicella gerlachiana]|uniref:group II intron reverse transcriptase/maturase n=1 Tax=Psittacicella gerlachiana TaxID=2028574 RepID=UPI0024821843|nr:group II intron reverse transcriptase/maturase [Psittacicella gerlachiana]